MFNEAMMKRCEALATEYCSKYKLEEWKLSERFTAFKELEPVRCWAGKPESFERGCYFIYSDNGALLYIGKASQLNTTIGIRLWTHFQKHTIHPWDPRQLFVQILKVKNGFEASSLEEFLIRNLEPMRNYVGRTNVLS